ncbi:LysR substrate-binding domain-containing protein [Shewanella sp. NIFS-20-20]|uniref:LysR substrate-binding domain-containing protein n=1 Tax=Shewanella sp. NIFS-20-20 TaxID=2853806 RepID=UPI00210C4A10|nr:LysR substrate-binding domain-containing protein [Shewanella sp. NIFS-20-20]
MPTDYVSRYLDSFFLLFIKAFTNINLIIDTDVSGNLLARLNRGAFDIIIATHWLTLPNAEKLFDRHFYWVTALNGNAHQQQAIPIALYPENCPIRVQVFANHSLTMPALNIVLSTPSPTALCEAVELGIAVAPIAEFRINDKMQKINPQAYGLPELPVFNESIYVVDNNDCPHRELLKQLLKHHQQSLTVK